MRCKEARIVFSYYMDNELSHDKVDGLKKHLSGCATCCQEIRQLQTTTGLIRGLFAAQKIPGLLTNFDRKFYRRIERRGFVWEWLPAFLDHLSVSRLAIGGVAVTMIFIGVMLTQPVDRDMSYYQNDLPLVVKQTLLKAEEIEQREILDNQAREMLEGVL